MPSGPRYTVTPQPINTLLTWVQAGSIAIPEIQRPFVWDATKVRNFIDSLYRGYPVGYLIVWKNPTIRLKDGTYSAGKMILIDGQQRITAIMAAILGYDVLNKDYETIRIKIAFNPLTETFEVSNPALQKSTEWLPDISTLFEPFSSLMTITHKYKSLNPDVDEDVVHERLSQVQNVKFNQVGIIDLAEDLDIDTVTEIFIRVNSAGSELSQADFAMSKIAANDTYGGNTLRKAIDYFCHLAVDPEFHKKIRKNDPAFAETSYFQKMLWLKDIKDDIYDPTYRDMLRVAFTTEFKRGKLQDLVALLSGRNFETKQFEEIIAEESFHRLGNGITEFMKESNFQKFVMILKSAGFITSDLISGQYAIDFAYILYLQSVREKLPAADILRIVRRWWVFSMLTGRYTSSPESSIDYDIRQIASHGVADYTKSVITASVSDAYWDALLPTQLETSSTSNIGFLTYLASQVFMQDRGFLSSEIDVHSLLLHKADVHHIFPRAYLKSKGYQKGEYNQVANFSITQSEINIQISDKPPKVYFEELRQQVLGGPRLYGGIVDPETLKLNLKQHCIPEEIFEKMSDDYGAFLEARRKLMARKIRDYFKKL